MCLNAAGWRRGWTGCSDASDLENLFDPTRRASARNVSRYALCWNSSPSKENGCSKMELRHVEDVRLLAAESRSHSNIRDDESSFIWLKRTCSSACHRGSSLTADLPGLVSRRRLHQPFRKPLPSYTIFYDIQRSNGTTQTSAAVNSLLIGQDKLNFPSKRTRSKTCPIRKT